MARITIDVDLTPEVEITGYQRYQDGHGLEVRWPLPARCRCEKWALPFFGASIPGFVGLLTGRGPFSPAFALIPGRSKYSTT